MPKIGLADFWHRCQEVPEAVSPACACGFEREMAQYVTLFCPRLQGCKGSTPLKRHQEATHRKRRCSQTYTVVTVSWSRFGSRKLEG
jgi:hypothetical protein